MKRPFLPSFWFLSFLISSVAAYCYEIHFPENITTCLYYHTTESSNCLTCGVPIFNTIDGLETDRVEPSWIPVPSASSYKYEIGLAGFTPGDGTAIKTGTVQGTWTLVTSLQPNKTYAVAVRSVCSNGEMSDFSAPFPFITSPLCGQDFYDQGGIDGNYPPNVVLCQTLCPDQAGKFAKIQFDSFSMAACCGRLEVYNSEFPTGLLLGTWKGNENPGTVEATNLSGCLSMRLFPSGGSGFGWDATFTCTNCPGPQNVNISASNFLYNFNWNSSPPATSFNIEIGFPGFVPGTGAAILSDNVQTSHYNDVASLEGGVKYEVYVQAVCGNTNKSDFKGPFPFEILPKCGDHFYDPGGPNGNYSDGGTGSFSYNICPDEADSYVQIEFHELDIDPCCASMTTSYFNDNGLVNIPVPLDGPLPKPIVSNGDNGCLNLSFNVSSTSGTGIGWDASINCVQCPPINKLFVKEVTDNLIRFDWERFDISGTIKWEIGAVGFMPGSGEAIKTGSQNITNNSPTTSGLSPNTEYELYARLVCQQNSSPFNEPILFRTAPNCDGHFYDPGGSGNDYKGNGKTLTTIICPEAPNNLVVVDFLEFELANFDQLTILDGNTSNSPPLDIFSGNDIPGQWVAANPTGCLSFKFSPKNNSAAKGWDALVTCATCRPVNDIFVINTGLQSVTVGWNASPNATSYDWEIGPLGFVPGSGTHLFSGNTGSPNTDLIITGLERNTIYEFALKADCGDDGLTFFSPKKRFSTSASCGDVFYDPGGPNAPYANNEHIVNSICPELPNQKLRIIFNLFNTQAGADVLTVIGDNGILGAFSGSAGPPPIISQTPGECFSFIFTSNGSGLGNGWEADIFCDLVPTDEAGDFSGAFQVFPNPSSTFLAVAFEYPEREEATLEVFDITGRLVIGKTWVADLGSNKVDLDISHLSSGAYLVVLKGAYGMAAERVVKY